MRKIKEATLSSLERQDDHWFRTGIGQQDACYGRTNEDAGRGDYSSPTATGEEFMGADGIGLGLAYPPVFDGLVHTGEPNGRSGLYSRHYQEQFYT